MSLCDIDHTTMIQTLQDANCDATTIEKFLLSMDEGRLGEAVRLLSCHRCGLLAVLHEAQRPIQILDYFINKLKETNQTR